MSERSYTVREIDDLRKACEERWLFGTTAWPANSGGRSSRSYMEGEKVKAVEELVRTHMIAGHTAQDIYEADQDRLKINLHENEKGAYTSPVLKSE